MLIKVPPGWHIPERDATPESVYWNRRRWLAAAGFGAAGPLLAQQGVRRNPEFTLDRPLTEEWAAISYNNFYEFSMDKQAVKGLSKDFNHVPWKLEITGLVNKPQTLDLDMLLKKMPVEERLYRHRCVETWSMAVPWTGFPFAAFAKLADPKPQAKWVRFQSVYRPAQMPGMQEYTWYPWPYFEAVRIDEAMNPLALLVTGLYGKPLPPQNGAPIRLALPWKYGFKSAKSIVRVEFTDKQPKTFWNSLDAREYGFFANVNPKVPHPRWSQAMEKLIPSMERRPTLLYNGYEKWVAAMYNGKEL